MAEPNLFKWRHYQSDIILLCVRWYLRYALSYRDLEEMMNERGLAVDHRKGQIEGVGKGDIRGQVRFVSSLFMIAE